MDDSPVETSSAGLKSSSPKSMLGKRKRRDSLEELKKSVKRFSKFQYDSPPSLPKDQIANEEKVHQAKLKIAKWRDGVEKQECPHPKSVKETLQVLKQADELDDATYDVCLKDLIIYEAVYL